VTWHVNSRLRTYAYLFNVLTWRSNFIINSVTIFGLQNVRLCTGELHFVASNCWSNCFIWIMEVFQCTLLHSKIHSYSLSWSDRSITRYYLSKLKLIIPNYSNCSNYLYNASCNSRFRDANIPLNVKDRRSRSPDCFQRVHVIVIFDSHSSDQCFCYFTFYRVSRESC